MPLSYITVLTGCCTLIGPSTNLLVDDMASVAGQPRFGMFEITPVGIAMALAGGLYLFLVSGRLLGGRYEAEEREGAPAEIDPAHIGSAQIGDASLFEVKRPLQPLKAAIALVTFVAAVALATRGVAPIAATAFAGAVLLILLRVISADEAYSGLRPEILILIAGMVVIGLAMEQRGLAAEASELLINSVHGLRPLIATIILHLLTIVLTAIQSNVADAVLGTPVAARLRDRHGVTPP